MSISNLVSQSKSETMSHNKVSFQSAGGISSKDVLCSVIRELCQNKGMSWDDLLPWAKLGKKILCEDELIWPVDYPVGKSMMYGEFALCKKKNQEIILVACGQNGGPYANQIMQYDLVIVNIGMPIRIDHAEIPEVYIRDHIAISEIKLLIEDQLQKNVGLALPGCPAIYGTISGALVAGPNESRGLTSVLNPVYLNRWIVPKIKDSEGVSSEGVHSIYYDPGIVYLLCDVLKDSYGL